MSCANELGLSMHVDGELGAAEAAALERHLETCCHCAARLEELRTETRLLRAALELPALLNDARAPLHPGRTLMAAIAAVAAAAGLQALWTLVDGTFARLPDWLNPLASEGGLNLLLNSLFYLLNPGGGAMDWSRTGTTSALAVLAVALAAAWAARRRPRLLAGALTLLVALAVASPAAAIEVRKGDQVAVGADESVQGSLMMAGETVRMEGSVEGDLVAFGREVIVRGPVSGGIYVFAQKVDLEGTAGGSVHAFGQWMRLAGTAEGSAYLFAQGIDLPPGSRIAGDVTVFGETVTVEGAVGRDLTAFGRRASLRGSVGGSLEAWTDGLQVAAGAGIGGDLRAHLPSEEKLEVADGATVGGEVSFEPVEQAKRRSRYAEPGFYLWGLVGLVGAFLVGAVLWWLAPWLLEGRPAGAVALLGRLGLGLLVLVATPICLLIVALTMVGLPLAVLGLVIWGVGIYLAKIATAGLVGRGLLGWPTSEPKRVLAALALGLALVTVAGALPWIGGWIGFLVLLLGLGLLGHGLWSRASARP